jgi:hypothetical protein
MWSKRSIGAVLQGSWSVLTGSTVAPADGRGDAAKRGAAAEMEFLRRELEGPESASPVVSNRLCEQEVKLTGLRFLSNKGLRLDPQWVALSSLRRWKPASAV